MTTTASRPDGRVPGVAWYLHRYECVVTCLSHAITRQRKGVDMFIPKLVCIPCKVEMVIDHTGYSIELAHSNGHKIKVASDNYICPSCSTVVARLADRERAQGWQPDYHTYQANLVARFADDTGHEE